MEDRSLFIQWENILCVLPKGVKKNSVFFIEEKE